MSNENLNATTETTAAVPATTEQSKGFLRRNAKKLAIGTGVAVATAAAAVGGWLFYQNRQQSA